MSSRFVNPFTDLGFKIIFGQPASKDLLIILLNELLSGEHHIEDLTFLDKEDRSENIHDKGIIYDLYCRTSTGEYNRGDADPLAQSFPGPYALFIMYAVR